MSRLSRRFWVPLGGLLLAAGVAYFIWQRQQSVEPPAVDLAGAEPSVVEAIEVARNDVRSSPRSAKAWGRLGMFLLAYKFHAEAITCFGKAEGLDSADPRWPYLHGVAALANDPETAAAPLQQAAELSRGASDVPEVQLGELHLQQGQLEDAERIFRRLLGRDPAHARAHLGLGRVAYERGEWDSSLDHLRRAIESRFTQKAAHSLMAEVYQRRQDRPAADRALGRAAELPDDAPWPDLYLDEVYALRVGREAYRARVTRLQSQGRKEEALQLVQEAERTYRDLYWLVEGRLRLERGNLGGAREALQRSLELYAHSAEAHFSLAEVHRRAGDDAAAVASYQETIRIEPGYGPAYRGLGRSLGRQGKRAEAIAALRMAVRLMPLRFEPHRELGELLAQDGRQTEAILELRQALLLNPEDEKAKELLDKLQQKP